MDDLKVGAETDAYCTSCKTMREHVIVAMVDDKPAKVECAECHKQHLFRAGPPGSKLAGAKKKRADAAKATIVVDLAARVAGREARTYNPSVGFGVGDVVSHPSFGVGLVTALSGPQKMEVIFEAGAKLLAHDRKSAIAPTLMRPARREDEDRRPVTDAPPARPAR